MAAASISCSRTMRTNSRSRAAPSTARPHGQRLDAQRLPAGRRREDVEERSAISSRSGSCAGDDWPGEVLRLNMLKTHYRSADRLDAAKGWRRARKTLWTTGTQWAARCGRARSMPSPSMSMRAVGRSQHAAGDRARCMVCDRCGPETRIASCSLRFAADARLPSKSACGLAEAQQARSRASVDAATAASRELIADRTAARARKDFKESDRIRDRTRGDGRRHQGFQGRHHLGDRAMTKPDTPFPKHWRYYICDQVGC